MKTFFQEIKHSVWGPEYFATIEGRSFEYSWGYLTKLSVLLSLIATIAASAILVPAVNVFLRAAPDEVLGLYPNELVLNIVDGKLSTNVTEPYVIPIPPKYIDQGNHIANAVVIDTTKPFSIEQYNAFNTYIWLMKDAAVTRDQQGKISFQQFSEVKSLTISKDMLRTWVGMVVPYLKFIAPFLVVIVFLGFLVFSGLVLLQLLFAALLVMVLGKVMHKNWSYGLSYRLSMHAVTLPLIFQWISFLGPNMGSLLFYGLILVVVYVNFREQKPVVSKMTPLDSQKEG